MSRSRCSFYEITAVVILSSTGFSYIPYAALLQLHTGVSRGDHGSVAPTRTLLRRIRVSTSLWRGHASAARPRYGEFSVFSGIPLQDDRALQGSFAE